MSWWKKLLKWLQGLGAPKPQPPVEPWPPEPIEPVPDPREHLPVVVPPPTEPPYHPPVLPPPTPPTLNVRTPPWWEVPLAGFNIRPYGRGFTVTPVGNFGWRYYEAIGWKDAAKEKRNFGPVAPDGDPTRVQREQQFLGALGAFPKWVQLCTGVGEQCPITFDPYIADEPHNMNKVVPREALDRGEAYWVSAHGKGKIGVMSPILNPEGGALVRWFRDEIDK